MLAMKIMFASSFHNLAKNLAAFLRADSRFKIIDTLPGKFFLKGYVIANLIATSN